MRVVVLDGVVEDTVVLVVDVMVAVVVVCAMHSKSIMSPSSTGVSGISMKADGMVISSHSRALSAGQTIANPESTNRSLPLTFSIITTSAPAF